MKTFTHVLVPTDFSDAALEALLAAHDLCTPGQTRLSIVHAIPNVWVQPWTVESGVDLAKLDRDWQEEARERLTALQSAQGLVEAGVTTAVLVGTPPHVAIVDYATKQHVDLIVMGSHGYGPVRRFLLGSVAERVIRTARCPVLTIPHETVTPAEVEQPRAELVGAVGGASGDRAVYDQC